MNCVPNPAELVSGETAGTAETAGAATEAADFLGVSQATHLVASCLLRSIQASHSHSLEDFLN